MKIKALAIMALTLLACGAPATFDAAQADQAAPAGSSASEPIGVRYARAYLALTKAELAKASEANQRVPGTMPASQLSGLELSVLIAEENLKQAQAVAEGKTYNSLVVVATENLKVADEAYQRAQEVNRRVVGTITATELERLRLAAEVAKLAVERSKALDGQPADVRLQWEVEQLREEVLRLRNIVAQLQRRN